MSHGTLYTAEWGNGVKLWSFNPEALDSDWKGSRVLCSQDFSGCAASAGYYSIDNEPTRIQMMNPFAGSTREFYTFEDGLEWLALDLEGGAL